MLCRNPFIQNSVPRPCGQCMPCRVNARRVWTYRIMLESMCHDNNSFLTLTYDDENLPFRGSLDPRHLQLFWKSLRKSMSSLRLRYFAVGEYGEKSERPHYHAAVFGLSPSSISVVQESWKKGFASLGTLTPESAQYIAGYVTKKMTSRDDPRLFGRYPEFSRQSNRPGIAYEAAKKIADVVRSTGGYSEFGDVPSSIKIGGRSVPLGRYIRRKMREICFGSSASPIQAKISFERQMQDLLVSSWNDEKLRSKTSKEIFVSLNDQKFRNFEAKHNLFNKNNKTI